MGFEFGNLTPKTESAEEDIAVNTWIHINRFDNNNLEPEDIIDVKPKVFHNLSYSERTCYQYDAFGIKREPNGNVNDDIVECNMSLSEDKPIKQEYFGFDNIKIEIADTKYEKPSFKCNKYDFKTELYCSYKVHIDNSHERSSIAEERFKCATFSKGFKQQSFLEELMAKYSLKKMQECEVCGSVFMLASSLRRHIRETHRVHKYECDICHDTFVRRTWLVAHASKHLSGIAERAKCKCSVCHKAYVYESQLRRHLRSRSVEKTLHCNNCSDRFKCRSSLLCHIEAKHLLKCTVCHKTFEDDLNLKRHIDFSCKRKVGDHKCEICQQTFYRPSRLKRHMRKHSENK